MFSLICVWINGWINNREAGDLRRYRAHSDVIVMNTIWPQGDKFTLFTGGWQQAATLNIRSRSLVILHNNEWPFCMDHSLYALSQWETALQCNTLSHWFGAYTEWSVHLPWQAKLSYNEVTWQQYVIPHCFLAVTLLNEIDLSILYNYIIWRRNSKILVAYYL